MYNRNGLNQNRNGLSQICLASLLLNFLSCASAPATQDFSNKAKNSIKWELITVQPDFVGKSEFLAVSEIDGNALAKPLIFGLDVVLLSPAEHQLKIVLGEFENYGQLVNLDSSTFAQLQKAELGTIPLKKPCLPKPTKGRNYLVASYDKIYASNTQYPKYMQRWLVNYPRRTIESDNNHWSIESLDPKTKNLSNSSEINNCTATNTKKISIAE